ncbi:23862_t:CDS:2, partial [Gigaspora rosea]
MRAKEFKRMIRNSYELVQSEKRKMVKKEVNPDAETSGKDNDQLIRLLQDLKKLKDTEVHYKNGTKEKFAEIDLINEAIKHWHINEIGIEQDKEPNTTNNLECSTRSNFDTETSKKDTDQLIQSLYNLKSRPQELK